MERPDRAPDWVTGVRPSSPGTCASAVRMSFSVTTGLLQTGPPATDAESRRFVYVKIAGAGSTSVGTAMDAKDASGPPPILGVVIAGGLSSRMGREKALISLAGKPLLAHVLERFRPQVDCVALNANGDPSRFAAFALEVAPDRHADHPGPLAGLAAALHLALSRGYELVATAPSDAPFLPLD